MKTLTKGWLLLCLALLAGCATRPTLTLEESTNVRLDKSSVEIYELGNIRLHAVHTADVMNDWVLIVEEKGRALVIESPAFKDNTKELQSYFIENEIRAEGILPSYHPFGAGLIEDEHFHGIDVYSTRSTIDYWDHGFGTVMKEGIPVAFGDAVDQRMYEHNVLLEEGEHKIAGMKVRVKESYDGFDIALPEIRAVYLHILGHDVHSEILGFEHLDSMIHNLGGFIDEGYEIFMSSHYKPETRKDAIEKLAYLKEMKKIAAGSATGEEFIAAMTAAYPGYQLGYLPMTAQQLFEDYKMPPREAK